MDGRFFASTWRGSSLLLLCCATALAPAQSTQSVVRTLPRRLNPPAAGPVQHPGAPPALEHFIPQAHPPETPLAESSLAWDAPVKEYTAKLGEVEALFSFNVTNVSSEKVTIQSVSTSCGCTVARLPSTPWILEPGGNGQLYATMDLSGKIGRITKALTVQSDKGEKTLLVCAIIPTGMPRPAPGPIPLVTERDANQKLAKADRQAVFRGDCAKCHVEPAKGKSGQELYAAACGICHDSPQRASTVPDLRHLNHDTSPEFWRDWVVHGKAGTMMPAFALSEGGPLTREQVDSLVAHLARTFPERKPAN